MKAMLRWQIPVDDEDHEVKCDGPVVATSTTHGLWSNLPRHWVEFWTYGDTTPGAPRVFRAFGTGQPIPDGYAWRGTADREGGLVWHLFERVAQTGRRDFGPAWGPPVEAPAWWCGICSPSSWEAGGCDDCQAIRRDGRAP